jgi:hypothetical protein
MWQTKCVTLLLILSSLTILLLTSSLALLPLTLFTVAEKVDVPPTYGQDSHGGEERGDDNRGLALFVCMAASVIEFASLADQCREVIDIILKFVAVIVIVIVFHQCC